MMLELIVMSGCVIGGSLVYQKKRHFFERTRQVKQRAALLLFGNLRRQQLLDISSDEEIAARKNIESITKKKLQVSFVSAGFAAVGVLVYAPIGLLSVPGILYVLQDAVVSSYRSLVEKRQVSVDVLIVLSKSSLLFTGHFFLCSATGIILAVNRTLLHKVKDNSKGCLVDVFRQQSQVARVMQGGVEREVSVSTLTEETIVVVAAGEAIPVDGTVVGGTALVDQHILTGESQPVEKASGDTVFASTLILSGHIQIQVSHIGEQTIAAQIGQLLNQTAELKTEQQLQAEVFSDRTVLPTLGLSALALPFWGTTSALVILQSHFKYRLTVISSVGLLNYLNLASRKQLLIKDGGAFERLSNVDTVVFDKTGTLTEEIPQVAAIHTCSTWSKVDILTYAAAAENKQTHPIAKAICQAAKAQNLILPMTQQAEYKVGYGLEVIVNNQQIQLGSIRFMAMANVVLLSAMEEIAAVCHMKGHTLILLAVDGELVGGVELHPTIRPEAWETIAGLRKQGVQATYIISGDQREPTKYLADKLGIDHYFAETLPEQKSTIVEELQREGKTVCFIGDGINDCVAMQKADVSISLGNASTFAIDTAQIILLDNTLNQLYSLFDLSKEFSDRIKVSSNVIISASLLGMGGALCFNMGLVAAILLQQVGLLVGVVSSMYPLIKHGFSASEVGEKMIQDKSIMTNTKLLSR
jgi:Cu2+-exporting ATPase